MSARFVRFDKITNNFFEALLLPEEETFQKLIDNITADYKITYERAKELIGVTEIERLEAKEPETFKATIGSLRSEMPRRLRQRKLSELFAPWAALLYTTGEEASALSFNGGRSGSLRFSRTITKSANPYINQLFEADPQEFGGFFELVPQEERSPEPHPGVIPPPGVPTFCQPLPKGIPVRAAVRKPAAGAETDPGTLFAMPTIDPAFEGFLLETGASEIAHYDLWLSHNSLIDTHDNRLKYAEELANCRKKFRESRFQQRFCSAGDAPAPRVHRGSILLRLPPRIGEKDLRRPSLYQGDAPYPVIPPVDFDVLLREYILPLEKEERLLLDVRNLSESAIRDYYEQHYSALFNPMLLDGSVRAAQYLIAHEAFQTLVQDENNTGGISIRGLSQWLDTDAALGIRTAISTILTVDQIPTSDGTSTPKSVQAFMDSFSTYCIPKFGLHSAAGVIDGIAIRSTTLDPNLGLDPGFSADQVLETFRAGLEHNVVTPYETLWTRAQKVLSVTDLIEKNILSPYELRCHAYNFAKVNFLLLTNNYDPSHEAALAFSNEVDALHSSGAMANIESLYTHFNEIWLNTDTLEESASADIKSIVSSYSVLIDTVISLLPAAALGAPQPSMGGTSQELFHNWKETFIGLLEHFSERRSVLDSNFLLLRLTPRKGAYGEVPSGRPEMRELSPAHPERITRAYQLEHLPEHFFRRACPHFYLREDYAIRFRHQGYGIGNNLYSLSLLPDEKQTITMKSFKDTTLMESENSAENIFEEEGSETAEDFSKELGSESQSESTHESSAYVDAEVSGSFFVDVSVKAGYSSKDSAREFAKNTSNVSNKLAKKLSAKRKVTIDITKKVEKTETTHDETVIVREIYNPNKGHTLTFNWFQINRKVSQDTELEDVKLLYSSGYFPPIRIYLNMAEVPADWANSTFAALTTTMPPDISRLLPENSCIVIVSSPYTELVPLSSTNAMLASLLVPEKASEVASSIWEILGYSPEAPDGLGVLAFSNPTKLDPEHSHYIRLYESSPVPDSEMDVLRHVAADEIYLFDRDGDQCAPPVYLPNLDLRYKQTDGLVRSRYNGSSTETYALSRLLGRDTHVIATNGVFCDAMVGNCSALETYLHENRELDLRSEQLKVALNEIDFEYQLAKNGLVETEHSENKPLAPLVAKGDHPFENRLAEEESRRLHENELHEKEIARLQAELDLLAKKVDSYGAPIQYSFDVPADTTLKINANIGNVEREMSQDINFSASELPDDDDT